MENLIIFISLLIGASLGSFSSLLIWRLHHEEKGILWGRSRCPECKKTLDVFNLIPIFSWIFQRGKCANCKKEISSRYPIIELVFAIVFVFFTQAFWLDPHFPFLMVSVFFVLVLFFYDLWFFEVDSRIAFPAMGIALIWGFFKELPLADFIIGGIGGGGFYALQYYLSKGRWVGFGDVWLGIFMGLLLGWKLLLLTFFVAYVGGSLVAIPLLIFKNYTRKSKLPMGAFLMPSTLLFLYCGEEIWEWYWRTILNL